MDRFPTAGHLASWAGVAPASYESAGKRRPAGTRHGSRHLRQALIEAARAASRTKGTCLSARYSRIARRRGPNKAAVAIAHHPRVGLAHGRHRRNLHRPRRRLLQPTTRPHPTRQPPYPPTRNRRPHRHPHPSRLNPTTPDASGLRPDHQPARPTPTSEKLISPQYTRPLERRTGGGMARTAWSGDQLVGESDRIGRHRIAIGRRPAINRSAAIRRLDLHREPAGRCRLHRHQRVQPVRRSAPKHPLDLSLLPRR